MTDRQVLVLHLEQRHRRLRRSGTTSELARLHASDHHRSHLGHLHAGPNSGPGDRPAGWRSGRDVVERKP